MIDRQNEYLIILQKKEEKILDVKINKFKLTKSNFISIRIKIIN